MEGLRPVFGEFVFAHYGVSKEQMIVSLFLGSAASLFVGSFFGVLSDLICIEHTLPRPCLEMYFGVSIVSKEETPGGYYWNIGNAVIMAFAALGLLTAAGSVHVLKRLGKQPYQNCHKM